MVASKIADIPADLVREMKRTGVWREDCPVAIDRLVLLEVTYCDFHGVEHNDGRLIAFDAAAEHLVKLFELLHCRRFPIAKISLMQEYAGDDFAAIQDNNTSCFNQRTIHGRDLISLHSYGLALDLNPMQNPCLTIDQDSNTVTVQGSVQFLNRQLPQPGMIEPIVPLVSAAGLTAWGGSWRNPIDYQHCQFPRPSVRLFDILSKDSAKLFFDKIVANPRLAARATEEVDRLIAESGGQESLLLEKLLQD